MLFIEELKSSPNTSSVFVQKVTNAPVTFIPAIDTTSISTFGNATSKSSQRRSCNQSNARLIDDNEATADTATTMDNRVSVVEKSCSEMLSMLQQLVDNINLRVNRPPNPVLAPPT